MRHWLWFVVAAVVAIGSLYAGGYFTFSRIFEIDRQLRHFPIPGSVSIEFDKPGTYTIFLDTQVLPHSVSAKLGKPATYTIHFETELPKHSEATVSGLMLRLVEKSSGEPIVLTTAPSTIEPYNNAGLFGAPILSFTIGNVGIYALSSALESGGTARISIARGEIPSMLRLSLVGLSIVCAGLAGAGIILAVTIWRRSKAPTKIAEA
jgi:hypothetical protein